jgi:CheY-like chemotaxis protein
MQAGFEVISVGGEAAALAALGPSRALPSLLIAGWGEGSDGFSLAEKVRAAPRLSHLPVLLLTQGLDAMGVELAAQSGADDCLERPIFVNDVVALARFWAGSSASARSFETSTSEIPLPWLLRALLAGVRSGRMELALRQGSLAFKKGRVISARFMGLSGLPALERMLVLAEGHYQVILGPGLGEGPMELSQRELCGRVLPELRQWEQAKELALPMEAQPLVDFPRLAHVALTLPNGIEHVLRLSDGRRSVRQIILESELSPLQTLQCITKLYALEVLAPMPVRVPEAGAAGNFAVALSRGWADLDVPPALGAEPATPSIRGVRRVAPAVMRSATPPAELVFFQKPGSARRREVPGAPTDPSVPVLGAEPVSEPSLEPELEPSLEPSLELLGRRLLRHAAPAVTVVMVVAAMLGFVGVVIRHGAEVSMKASALSTSLPGTAAPSTRPSPAVPPAMQVRLLRATELYRAGSSQKANGELEALVQDYPKLPDAWLAVALARFDTGDVRGARIAAAQAVAQDPNEPRAHLVLAGMHEASHDPAGTREELLRYLQLDPKGRFAEQVKRLLHTQTFPTPQ